MYVTRYAVFDYNSKTKIDIKQKIDEMYHLNKILCLENNNCLVHF